MKPTQSSLRNRNGRTSALRLWIVLALLLAPGGCDFVVPAGAPSSPGEPPAPDPGDEPPPGPGPTWPGFTRAPYLQSLGKNSVIVAFRTHALVTPTLDYGPTQDYGSSVTGPAATLHAIELRGLLPGRRYAYRVREGSEVLASGGDFFFETDAGAADPEFSFFVTGDIGDPGGDQALTGRRILETRPRAEIGLLTGDIIYPDGEAADYDPNLMRPWAPLLRNVAVYAALGNHDWHVDPETNFRAQWYLPNNEHYYSFDRGNAHFIALDTRNGDIYDRANQVAWLREDLATHRDADWTFVFYHHPGYTCTYKGNEGTVIEYFHPLFDEFGVDVAFMGHAHTYERLYPMRGASPVDEAQDPDYRDPGGTLYIVTGCGSKTNSSSTPDCAINATAIDDKVMFTHVTVRGNVVTIRQIESANGTVRDQASITKTGL